MNRFHAASVLLVIALASALCVASAFSQPAGNPAEGVGEQPQAEQDTLTLRDPFWPIGWHPPNFDRNRRPDDDISGHLRWEEALRLLKITGLSRKPDGTYLAVLKGAGVVEKGDLVSVRHNLLVYRWRIADITSEGIMPERIDASRNYQR